MAKSARPARKPKPLIAFIFCLIFAVIGLLTLLAGHAQTPYQNLLFDSDRTGNYEIYTVNTSGQVSRLTTGSSYDSWWPKPSPDGTKILFYRTPKGVHDTDYTKTSLWMMDRSGANVHQIIANGANGWQAHGHGEWSPDSKRIVMFAGAGGLLIVHTNAEGGDVKLVKTGSQTQNTDPSWSPDGASVLYAYQGNVWKTPVDGNGATMTQLTSDSYTDYDPYFSPNGQQVAFLTRTTTTPAPGAWAIRLVGSNGTGLQTVINDGNVNSKPEWSPTGDTIYFHRHPSGAGSGYFGLWFIKPSGAGLTAIDVGSGSNEFPAVLPAVATASAPSSSTPTSTSTNTSTDSGGGSASTQKTNPTNPSQQPGSAAPTSTTPNGTKNPATKATTTGTNTTQKNHAAVVVTASFMVFAGIGGAVLLQRRHHIF